MASLVLIGLGSNLGHPRRRIARAIDALAWLPRSRLLAVSGNYVSAPLDVPQPQPDYVNAVALLHTALAPSALLARMRAIERRLGRRRTADQPRNAPRTIDLDLLLYGRRRISQPSLVVPHPRMHERAFVLRPLLDIAPAASIPGRGAARTVARATRGQRIARTRRHVWR
jgi:2-amino-4-hydroxy-6-hydroxymethyldihydropteridine diphosphokinase